MNSKVGYRIQNIYSPYSHRIVLHLYLSYFSGVLKNSGLLIYAIEWISAVQSNTMDNWIRD